MTLQRRKIILNKFKTDKYFNFDKIYILLSVNGKNFQNTYPQKYKDNNANFYGESFEI